ncbi:hypothetical protein PIROE2DRAFT_42147 [Piromyces sp. E2]|nr:hypothetical protein PIROE2DRAFT_42147 [Piromyces sp. E2]|eukprot:OUM64864.1 hypothetical protein PIROE2DRAFT_42147 [Piromyces sp. E2]
MRVNDRTQEFYATVESMLSRRPFNESFGLMSREKNETQFYKIAMGIGKENENTKGKLKKLEELVQQNTLLDDKLPEITQMIQIIKVDISKMSTEINAFQQAFKDKKIPYVMNGYAIENANNIISSLQTKLLNTSNEFKDILELRTKIMREQKLRKEQYSSTGGSLTGSNASSLASSPHLFGSRIMSKIGTPLSRSNTGSPAPPVPDDDDDNGKGKSGSYPYAQQQQQQLYEPYSQSYLDSRSSAIDAIEATMTELGQIYQNFTHILAGQRETIQRIDDDILNVDMNVTGAQDYLMKYYKSISSNRWLIIKILIVVLIFFFIFVVFL